MSAAITDSGIAIPRYLVEPLRIKPIDFCHKFQREFKDLAFYEIVEGTSIYAFFQNGEWRLSCDDDKSLYNDVASFKDACKALNVDLDRDLDQNFTYSFVFRTPDNEYVNSSLNSYEIYIVGVYSVNKNNDVSWYVPFNLSDVTSYKCRGEQPCYKNNRTILIPHKVKVQLDKLSLIVKEWGVGDGLPNIILNDDDYDRRAFIHDCSEKGITMVHVPTGTTSHVLNRYYLNYIKKQQKQDTN